MLLSNKNTPKALLAWLGSRLHEHVAFAHVCLSCISTEPERVVQVCLLDYYRVFQR